ncbi:MAG: ribonuclease P protein component 4 [Metallosphaera sp.]|uniref:Ribonuclease P protein component 4 n=1 Tax=Metallosphaera cuprina (strain Ar-4) TaxID=1006006 RepID=F4FY82_METCR|nr:ribonuclease P protein component 4 [Metallosphaera cuprina]AEB95455.1 RNAse P, Rpr2/Rpp21 subunit [Metallosphaera cuprina Ar-4]
MTKRAILERSEELIDLAYQTALEGNLDLSRKYVKLALAYSSKARIKLPVSYKRRFCRVCLTPLVPGLTERRRIRSKILIRTCLVCGWIRRYDTRDAKKLKGIGGGRRGKDREERVHSRDERGDKQALKGSQSR